MIGEGRGEGEGDTYRRENKLGRGGNLLFKTYITTSMH